MIRTIALLHQYQRKVKTARHGGREVQYIEVTKADIAVANRLAHEVLGRSLDELPPQTRRMLNLLEEMVAERAKAAGIDRSDFRFTRREVRNQTGWTDFPVRTHLDKLVSLEYVIVHRGSPGQRFVYELLYDGEGEGGRPFLMGLIDVEGLGTDRKHDYDSDREGSKGDCEGRLMPARCPSEPRVRSAESAATDVSAGALRRSEATEPENALLGLGNGEPSSYVPTPVASSSLSRS